MSFLSHRKQKALIKKARDDIFLTENCIMSQCFCCIACSPELHDVVIVSEEGTELKCHKCILVARLGMYSVHVREAIRFYLFVLPFVSTTS